VRRHNICEQPCPHSPALRIKRLQTSAAMVSSDVECDCLVIFKLLVAVYSMFGSISLCRTAVSMYARHMQLALD